MSEFDDIYDANNPLPPETDQSIESATRGAFPAFLEQRRSKEHYLCEQILNHKLAFETTLTGCDSMTEASLNQSGSYMEYDGPDPEIPAGFIQVVKCLAENIPDEKIRLNCPVTNINYGNALSGDGNASNGNAKLEENRSKIEITLETGHKEQFDHVVVTSSINFLKQNHKTFFKPPLDSPKQEALSRTAMGTVDKIFLQFPHLDFIPSTWRIICFVWPLDVDRGEWTSRMHAFAVVNTPKQDTLSGNQ